MSESNNTKPAEPAYMIQRIMSSVAHSDRRTWPTSHIAQQGEPAIRLIPGGWNIR